LRAEAQESVFEAGASGRLGIAKGWIWEVSQDFFTATCCMACNSPRNFCLLLCRRTVATFKKEQGGPEQHQTHLRRIVTRIGIELAVKFARSLPGETYPGD
jgi:hypothetical protein